MFKKYMSIENHYQNKFINQFVNLYPELHNVEFVIEEKLDGSNISILFTPNKPIVLAKRNSLIEEGENFYDIHNVISKYNNELKVFQNAADKELQTIRLYGEIYGKGIQKRVDYSSSKEIRFFGLMINDELVTQEEFFEIFEKNNLMPLAVPKIAIVKGLQNALDYNVNFNTFLRPHIRGNIAEGIVIKPWKKVYFDKLGRIFYLKKKNEKFKDKPKVKKEIKKLPENVQTLKDEFVKYLNDNRVRDIFSKYGEIQESSQIGNYIKYFIADAKEDFIKDYPEVLELDKKDQKNVFNTGALPVTYIKKYL